MSKHITEQVDIGDVKVLFHASHVGNLDSIKNFGVMPMHGEIVDTLEVYQQYQEWEEELTELAFFSPENPGFVNWQVANYLGKDMWDTTVDDIRKYGVVTVLYPWNHAEDIYCSQGDGTAKNLDGEEIYDVPGHVESVDCFSFEVIEPDMILTGDALINFLKKYYPSVIRMAEGEIGTRLNSNDDAGYVPEKPNDEQDDLFQNELDDIQRRAGIVRK